MSHYREKGYYSVPADDIDLSVDEGEKQPSYDPMRYVQKQKEMARKSQEKLNSEKYKNSRYC